MRLSFVACLTGILSILGSAGAVDQPTLNVYELGQADADFSTLVAAVEKAGYVAIVSTTDPLTLFAPTNAAFAAIQPEVDRLLEDQYIEHLRELLEYHLTGSRIFTDDLVDGEDLTTFLDEQLLSVSVSQNDVIQINDATVTGRDTVATNGHVQKIDAVLLPISATNDVVDIALSDTNFSKLVELLTRVDLVSTLRGPGPFTVYAPSNAAFAEIGDAALEALTDEELTDILLYHVVPAVQISTTTDDGLYATFHTGNIEITQQPSFAVNGIVPDAADLLAKNGVVHAIGTVLTPSSKAPTFAPSSMPSQTQSPTDAPRSLVEIAVEDFPTLATAVGTANLTEALSGTDPLTVFAPTDDAFSDVQDTVDKLLTPQFAAHLDALLLYHVTAGAVLSTDLTDGMNIPTLLQGENVTADVGTTVEIMDFSGTTATVIDPDIIATNGVVHGIDKVLLPPSAVLSVVDVVQGSADHTTLFSLLEQQELTAILGSSTSIFTLFAPTNDAFTKVDEDRQLTGDPLRNILSFHATVGVHLSTTNDELEALQKDTLTLVSSGGTFTVNGLTVVTEDILASNGVVHVITDVLLPPTPSPTFVPTQSPPTTMRPTAPKSTAAPPAGPTWLGYAWSVAAAAMAVAFYL